MLSKTHEAAVRDIVKANRAKTTGFGHIIKALCRAQQREWAGADDGEIDEIGWWPNPDAWRIDFINRTVIVWEVTHSLGMTPLKRYKYGSVTEQLREAEYDLRLIEVHASTRGEKEWDTHALAMEYLRSPADRRFAA